MSKIYHKSVNLDSQGRPVGRGFLAPIGGIWYWQHSIEYKAARKKMRGARNAIKKAQWKENAEAERNGEFVPIPGVYPVAMQYDLWEEGRFKSTFWQDLWDSFGADEDE